MRVGQLFKPEGEEGTWEVIELLSDQHCIIRKLFDKYCKSDKLYFY